MADGTILYAVEAGVATLTLNRPEKLNAFNDAMHLELREALARAADDDTVRALLLTGAGRGFCAGQDLSDRKFNPAEGARDLGATVDQFYNPLVRTLRALPKPVVAAVNGVAAGAGCNIALACDIVLAARSASFLQAFARIGIVPDSGGTFFLPRLVGHARAMALALLAEPVSAERAVEIGLIWQCHKDATLMPEATALARHLSVQPTKGLGLIKQALNASFDNDLDRQLDLERNLQRMAGRTEDYREGIAAFLEKRKADFKGR
jgi:2-(1,2-epoxy-1,2-dihydrophenyl)acetyl-CoA isomerase